MPRTTKAYQLPLLGNGVLTTICANDTKQLQQQKQQQKQQHVTRQMMTYLITIWVHAWHHVYPRDNHNPRRVDVRNTAVIQRICPCFTQHVIHRSLVGGALQRYIGPVIDTVVHVVIGGLCWRPPGDTGVCPQWSEHGKPALSHRPPHVVAQQ